MSTPIEQAALALYEADDAVVAAYQRAKAHACWSRPWPSRGAYSPCDRCAEAIAEAQRQQRSAENALMLAIREARPR